MYFGFKLLFCTMFQIMEFEGFSSSGSRQNKLNYLQQVWSLQIQKLMQFTSKTPFTRTRFKFIYKFGNLSLRAGFHSRFKHTEPEHWLRACPLPRSNSPPTLLKKVTVSGKSADTEVYLWLRPVNSTDLLTLHVHTESIYWHLLEFRGILRIQTPWDSEIGTVSVVAVTFNRKSF